MWQDRLNAVIEIGKKHNRRFNGGVPNQVLQTFEKEVISALGTALPDFYTAFLSVINGVRFNGVTIYGVDKEYCGEQDQSVEGLIASNRIWYENEWQQEYLFLGTDSITWYVYDKKHGVCRELDKPSGEEMGSYDCSGQMLENMLKRALNAD